MFNSFRKWIDMSEDDLNIIIGKLTKKLLIIIIPSILVPSAIALTYDHFAIRDKASYKDLYNLQLVIEGKTRATEDLVNSNSKDIGYINEQIDKIEKANEKINDLIIKEFGNSRGIPELSDNL